MEQVYGKYNKEKNCWISREKITGLHYCMRIARYESVSTGNNRKMVYLVTTGEAIEDIGHAHVVGGGYYSMMAYQIDGKNTFKLIASMPMEQGGDYGYPPDSDQFTFIKIGANRYGWRLDEANARQGNGWTFTSFYTPYKGKFRNVFSLLTKSSFSTYDSNYDKEEVIIEKNRTVDINFSDYPTDEFYPLKIVVDYTGKDDLSPGTYEVRFSESKNKYVAPLGSPLADELNKN